MPLEGDTKKLAQLAEKLRNIEKELVERVETSVETALNEQLEYQYETGTDPDNEGWAELAP